MFIIHIIASQIMNLPMYVNSIKKKLHMITNCNCKALVTQQSKWYANNSVTLMKFNIYDVRVSTKDVCACLP